MWLIVGNGIDRRSEIQGNEFSFVVKDSLIMMNLTSTFFFPLSQVVLTVVRYEWSAVALKRYLYCVVSYGDVDGCWQIVVMQVIVVVNLVVHVKS